MQDTKAKAAANGAVGTKDGPEDQTTTEIAEVPDVAQTGRLPGVREVTEYHIGIGDGIDVAVLLSRSPTFRDLEPNQQRQILREALL